MKTYQTEDLVVSTLQLPQPCRIEITIDDDYLKLYVGGRDWMWDIKTGELTGSGCRIINEAEKPSTQSA